MIEPSIGVNHIEVNIYQLGDTWTVTCEKYPGLDGIGKTRTEATNDFVAGIFLAAEEHHKEKKG